ncbi:MAG: hypothetical protein ABSA83_07640 [Verrucomicrobiota bacterium]|jgi:hypothetical protein
MSIFTLHSSVVKDYRDFVRSFFPVADDRAREFIGRNSTELDAWFASAYGQTRDELRYILDPAGVHGPDFPGETFRVLKEKKTAKFGEYRTRRLLLEARDRLEGGKEPP